MRTNQNIRDYIKDNGMTYSFVARRSGIDIKKFSRYMSLKQPLTTDEYELICKDGLRVDPSYFFQKKFLETQNIAQ